MENLHNKLNTFHKESKLAKQNQQPLFVLS